MLINVMLIKKNHFVEDLSKVASQNMSWKFWTLIFRIIFKDVFRTQSENYDGAFPAKIINGYASDFIHPYWFFLCETNTNVQIHAWIIRNHRYNMKNQFNLQWKINSTYTYHFQQILGLLNPRIPRNGHYIFSSISFHLLIGQYRINWKVGVSKVHI